MKSDDTFVWILWPLEGAVPNIQAKILNKDADAVKVKVTEPGKESWIIEVPFLNSKAVIVEKTKH